MAEWRKVAGEKGIYVRDYGAQKSYKLQGSYRGQRVWDMLGVMELAEVKKIQAELAWNRKRGVAPLTYSEMRREEAERERAQRIESTQRSQELIREDMRRNTNTVERLWECSFYPHRLTLKRSARETQTIAGRWENHVKPHFGGIPLEELARKDFEAFVRMKREEGKLSETTIFKCLTDLRQAWAWGVEEGLISHTFPGRSVIREVGGELDNEKKCYLEPEEARLLLKTVYERRLKSRIDHDVYCFTMFGLGLGLRAGDICKLTLQSIERHIIDRTKNKRSRFVHFSFAPIEAMIMERLELYPPSDPKEPLFLHKGADGQMKARTDVPKKFFHIIAELAFNETDRRKGHPLERIDFHALRHTFATMAAMRGVDHLTLMRLMGHKTPAMTLRYIEIADAHQAKHQERAMAGIFPQELQEGESKKIREREQE